MLRYAPLALALALPVFAADANSERLGKAAVVFQEVMDTPDKGIPQELLANAECAVIIPGLKKGAFIVGAKYGRGFFSCRNKGSGWSPPAAVRIEGGSFGLQIGGSETDVVMLVMNQGGADRLLSSKFTLGGDASVAAGPVGRSAQAETDAYMTAQILTWSRSRGAFAGLSLSGATLRQDLDVNQALYGKPYENKDIIRSGTIVAPASAASFLAVLNKHSSRK
ncbi:MAG TPA: lipid-binding SYLF domain-containing protein [Bryobacteraceae bacterium]|nr:lipid-binding SYLF domain-containing protein [Bryobacteraceae bacterium]